MKTQKRIVSAIVVLILSSIFLSEASLMLFDQPIEEAYEEREEKRDSLEEENLIDSKKVTFGGGRDYISNTEFVSLNCNLGISTLLDDLSHSEFSQKKIPLFLFYCNLKVDFC